jgi:hypothetical protein
VLLSAVDFLQDVALRRRAVEATGALGDARALDPLLKIATEDEHVLQDAAAEALGRLGRSPAAGEVFKLLERLAKARTPGRSRALTAGCDGSTRRTPGGCSAPRPPPRTTTAHSAGRSPSSSWRTTTTRPPAICC